MYNYKVYNNSSNLGQCFLYFPFRAEVFPLPYEGEMVTGLVKLPSYRHDAHRKQAGYNDSVSIQVFQNFKRFFEQVLQSFQVYHAFCENKKLFISDVFNVSCQILE